MRFGYPMPSPGAGWPARFFLMVVLPMLVGVAVAAAVFVLVGSFYGSVVLCAVAFVYLVHSWRWSRRFRRELAEAERRYRDFLNGRGW